jgi:hypothetical protein
MPKKLITKENAQEYREKGLVVRRDNIDRSLARKEFGKLLLGKKKISKKDLQELGDDVDGFKVGKKVQRYMLDLAKIREKAIETGNVRGYIELMKMLGWHFDQSPEALGGSENPLNVQAVAIAPKQVKDISEALEDNC